MFRSLFRSIFFALYLLLLGHRNSGRLDDTTKDRPQSQVSTGRGDNEDAHDDLTPVGRRACPTQKSSLCWKAISKYKLPEFDHLNQMPRYQWQPRFILSQMFLVHRTIRKEMYTTCKPNLVTRPHGKKPQSLYCVTTQQWRILSMHQALLTRTELWIVVFSSSMDLNLNAW